MIANSKRITFWSKIVFYNLLLAIGIIFVFCPSCFLSLEGIISVADSILYSFIICLILGFGNGYLVDQLDLRISWIKTPIKRLVVGTITVIVFSFIASVVIVMFFRVFIFKNMVWNELTMVSMLNDAKLPVYIALVITIALTSRSFLMAWKKSALDIEKLKRENLQAQYDALKNQINPHFLFNSFNVLTDLVYMDQDLAAQFIQQLSKVFRYVLESSKKELVSLATELAFLQAYIFLLKIRFGENVTIQLPTYEDKGDQIIPLCLQMLIENAIKHNVITAEEKLHVDIEIHDGRILVRNNLQLRNAVEGSTRLGLANIKARYALLNQQDVDINSSPNTFTVSIPLIPTL